MKLGDLVNKDLSGFKIWEMTHVYKGDEDGHLTASFGYFKNEELAKAFAGIQTDSSYFHTEKVLVLTNGEVGFFVGEVGEGEPVKFVDDEKIAVETKEKILAKLTEADRSFLGL